MHTVSILKVFMSGPSDVSEEMNSVKTVLVDLNSSLTNLLDLEFKGINWKNDIYSDFGTGDGQQVINSQVIGAYDIFIGILWQKLGSPTDRADSGTVEEIENALKAKRSGDNIHVMLYFKQTPPKNMDEIDIVELQRLREFKKSIGTEGLYTEFNSTEEFETHLKMALTNLLKERLSIRKEQPMIVENAESIQGLVKDDYSDITSILNAVNSEDDYDLQENIIETSGIVESAFNSVTSSLELISPLIEDIGNSVGNAADELSRKVGPIKDVRLKGKMAKSVSDKLAKKISELNGRVEIELPIIKDNMILGINSYSKMLLLGNTNEKNELLVGAKSLRDGMESAARNATDFLQSMHNIPPFGEAFNKSKRILIASFTELIREILEGMRLLDKMLEKGIS